MDVNSIQKIRMFGVLVANSQWLYGDCLGFEAKSTDSVLYSIDPNVDILPVNFDSRPKTVKGNRSSHALLCEKLF